MAITDWPEEERPREKLLARGAQALSDAELLAILLRVGLRGGTAVDLGRELIGQSGGLRQLLEMPPERLKTLRGLGGGRSAMLLASLELGRRFLDQEIRRGEPLRDVEAVGRWLTAELRGESREVFLVLFLDNKLRVRAVEKLFKGTVNVAPVYPREVVRRAMDHNACSVILAHNHPSGVAEPSEADREVTVRLSEALRLVDVQVLDHLVIGEGGWESFARRGWME